MDVDAVDVDAVDVDAVGVDTVDAFIDTALDTDGDFAPNAVLAFCHGRSCRP